MFTFPEGFLWGAATASYQVEGWNENTDWSKAAKAGRVAPAGRLADHYHRYEEDFDLAKELGHNAHRFSVEWARLEPREGEWDEKEFEHYRLVIDALRKRNIEPFITCWHFTLPQWVADKGGFENKETVALFARYCEKVVEELGEDCTHFSTINEPNIFSALGWLRGAWPPFKRFSVANLSKHVKSEHRASESTADVSFRHVFTWFVVLKNLVNAHNKAAEAMKKKRSNCQVSIVKHVHVYTSDWNPLNIIKARLAHYFLNAYIGNRTHKTCDEIGLNYYRYTKFGDKTQYGRTDMGWKINPEHIEDALRYLAKFKKPIFISEAGVADQHDAFRSEYIRKQIQGVARAMDAGVQVTGHLYWSLLDNYEWDLGVGKRFGLIEVNYETLERTVRPSALEYKAIIKNNAIDI